MLEIETKLGLIIAPNGDKRYFGKQSYEITKEKKIKTIMTLLLYQKY